MPGQDGYLLAVDVGTTTTRCVLFDLDGRPVGEAYREPRIYYPRANWTEVDPEDWWACTAAVIRDTLGQVEGSRDKVLGLGLCGLMHAVVPIDRSGHPLARAMLWMDQRCWPQAERLHHEHGEAIAQALGRAGPVSTVPSAPKMRWLVENEPDLVQRTHVFLLVKDYVRYKLTGSVGTDPSDAGGTMLYDRRSGTWSGRVLDLIGVPLDKLPPVLESTAVAGRVTRRAAGVTGLAAGTPVVTGGGDVLCTLIGTNAHGSRAHTAPTRTCLYLGTAAWMSVAHQRSAGREPRARSFGATATTGASLKWLSTLLNASCPGASPVSYETLVTEAEGVPIGARGLVFLPHLMGERAPECRPEARGVLFGLTLAHRQGDIARAVLEGCAFQLRRIAEQLAPRDLGEIVVVGGAAKSAAWVRIISDVLGVSLSVPQVLEAGALGAAILAGVGVGVYASIQSAAERLVRVAGRFDPDPRHHQRYDQVYSIFQRLEHSVAPLYNSVCVG